jgi:ABC-type phosphate transport system substrate-binding protein
MLNRNSIVMVLTATMIVFAGEMAIVVPKAMPIEKLTKEEAAKYFLKKVKKWPDGKKIKSFDSQGPARISFLKDVLKMSPADLERHWIELQYQTGSSPAEKGDNDAAVLKEVGKSEGGIAVVDAESAKSDATVKVVLTLKY